MRDYVGIFRGAPMLKIFVAFALGIYLRAYIPLCFTSLLWVAWAVLGLSVALHLLKTPYFAFAKKTSHLLLFLLVFLVGTLRMNIADISVRSDDIQTVYREGMMWQGTVVSSLGGKDYQKYTLALHTLLCDSTYQTTHSTIIVYDYARRKFENGTEVMGSENLVRIQNKGNPGEFDAERFYTRKGIFYSAFVRDSLHLKRIDTKPIPSLIALKNRIKQNITTHLEHYLHYDSSAIQLSLALILGKEVSYSLSDEVMDDFVTAGIVHIIVISGFQLGILASTLSFLFGLLFNKKSRWHLLVTFLVVGLVWGFIYLVGADISILRAGLMFTFVYINDTLSDNRQSPLQVLALSAMLILMLHPFDAWSLSFLYSFTALLGIFITQALNKYLTQSLNAHPMFKHPFREALASISASLFTVPITAVTFGKFYTYFFIAGLLGVYMSMALLYLTCLIICFSWWSSFAGLLGELTTYLAHLLLDVVHWIASLPFASLDFHFSLVQGLLLGLAIFCLVYAINYFTYRRMIFMSLFCVLIVTAISIHQEINYHRQSLFCALSWDRTNIPLLVVNGKKGTFIISKDMLAKPKKLDYLEQGIRQAFHLNSVDRLVKTPDETMALTLGEKNILVLSDHVTDSISEELLSRADYVVVQGDNESLLPTLERKNKHIIFYGSARQEKLGLQKNAHNLRKEGAFILE